MGKIYTPQPISSETNFKLTLNNNLTDIETALDKVLSRDGESPNQMNADLDMNSNDILNGGRINGTAFYVNGEPLDPVSQLQEAKDYADAQDVINLASANTYTDSQITALGIDSYLTKLADVEVITGTSYTITSADSGKIIWANNAATITITLPEDATENLSTGFQFVVVQAGLGQVTFVTTGAGSIFSKGSLVTTSDRYSAVSCFKQSSNNWWLGGDLA